MTNSKISAKIVADSRNAQGDRVTTFVLQFPRIVLAEFNTHRALSRNSASSRAIPFEKMVKMVKENPFIPIKWMKEHKGMQGSDFFTDEEAKELNLLEDHLLARDFAVQQAEKQSSKGLTKQIVNRYLEPFMWHTVICTGTEWENFFALRAHPAAEIHIAALAQLMLDAYNENEPKLLKAGEWHIPFGGNFDYTRLLDNCKTLGEVVGSGHPDEDVDECLKLTIDNASIKIATARCARVSYLNFEGKDDYIADIKLFDMLSTSGHWSPFEHCAIAMTDEEYYNDDRGVGMSDKNSGWSGNFRGFTQYRKTFSGENKTDERVKKTNSLSLS